MTFLDSFSESRPDTGFAKSQPDTGFGGVLKGIRGITDALAENFARDPEIRASRKKARIDRQAREEIQENVRQKAGIERLRFLGKLAVEGFIKNGQPVPDIFAQIGKSIALSIGGDLGEEEGQTFLARISQPPPGQEPPGPESPIGKLQFDRAAAVEQFGEGSSEVQQIDAVIGQATTEPVQPLNLFFPDGRKEGFDKVTQKDEIIAAFEQGAVPVGLSVQATSPDQLVGGQATIRRLREQETSTRIVLGDINRMTQQLSEGKTFTSVVSGAVTAINSLVGTALQAASLLDFDDRPLLIAEYEFGVFQEEAEKSATFRSNVIKLAYAVARSNDPAARLTDRDVQNALKQIGTASGSKDTIIATLNEVAQGAVRAFRANFETMDRQTPGAFGNFPPDFDERLKSLTPSTEEDEEFSQEDLEFTAKKHGISVEEVKRRLRGQKR